ncbi:nitroreductase family protein [candidate division WOR-3 bacterium]|nr:nitroreductase family protein [candidate division WOR-3 bacterium]
MLWLMLVVGLSIRAASLPPPTAAAYESLPGPVRHACSFEQLANSRYSVHSGFDDSLPRQVLANVLWAMSRAPRADSGDRDLYVATADNVYRFDQSQSRLIVHLPGDHRYNSSSAFEVGVATERPEDAGMAIQAGLLAGAAFNEKACGTGVEGRGVVSCPMQWAADHADADWKPEQTIQMVNVYGRAGCTPLDTLCAARSSDSSLMLPHVVGPDTFEAVMADLGQDTRFSSVGLSDENVSQLLWAAYGVTPHLTFNRRQGLTVPSAMASYFLTDRIYVVGQYDVSGYRNRLAGEASAATRDHRIERTIPGDRRPQLRAASDRIPGSAPVYFVVCVPDTAQAAAMMEAGFAGFQLLAQARALGLAGSLVAPLDRAEREAIAMALELPDGHVPALVFACGEAERVAAAADLDNAAVTIVRAQPAIRRGELRVEYLLNRAGAVRVEVFDMLGRPVRLLLNEQQTSGYHAVVWDGTDHDGARLKRGTYLIVVISGGTVARHKVDIG